MEDLTLGVWSSKNVLFSIFWEGARGTLGMKKGDWQRVTEKSRISKKCIHFQTFPD